MSTASMGLVVVGAGGRMGAALIREIAATPAVRLAGAIERAGTEALGRDAGVVAGLPPLGVTVSDDPVTAFAHADGVLDFTTPAATAAFSALAAQARIVHVIGTTGCGEAEDRAIAAAARHTVMVKSGNMSLGVNLLAALARQAAAALGPDYDIEIVEMHHRHKVDAPSGTALMLGQAAAAGRGIDHAAHAVRGRDGLTGPRPEGAIGYAALRGGSVIGDHEVILAGPGERLVLGHRADDRSLFAKGALKAALWGWHRKPGLYGMADVLGL